MKNLKKTSISLIIFIISIVIIPKVRAAYAYSWVIDGKGVNEFPTGASIEYVDSSTNYGANMMLVLENYNGSMPTLTLGGTGLANQVFLIKLTGQNTINLSSNSNYSDDIVANLGKYIFVGEGTLEFKSGDKIIAQAISIDKKQEGNNSIVEDKKEETNIPTTESNNSQNEIEKLNEKNNNLKLIVLGFSVYSAIATILAIVFGINASKKNKNV